MLPDPERDEHSGEAALVVALGGVICPVPYLMSGAALRMAGKRRSRASRAAFWVACATIVAQTAGLVALAVWVL